MEPSELRPPRPPHPFAAKGRALVDLISMPEIAQPLEEWLDDGICGSWHGIENGNPGDFSILLDRQMEPRPAPLRPTWPVQFRIGLTFVREQTHPTVRITVSLTPKFPLSYFEWATMTQVLRFTSFLGEQAHWGQKAEGVLRDSCKKVGLLVL